MNKQAYSIFAILIITIFVDCSQPTINYPENLQQLRKNVISVFLNDTVDVAGIEKLLNNINVKGEWQDIDYTNLQRGRWPVLAHLQNLQLLVKAYQIKESEYYQNNGLAKKIHLTLNYWLDNDFKNPNWWNNQIGVPKTLAPILFAMEEELTADQIGKAVKILDRSQIRMAGQNKVWLSGNVLYKSLLLRRSDSIDIASKAIKGELKIGKLGIQTDMSYHEHGAMLQFGNYGLSYLGDMVMWMEVFNGTAYQFSEDKIALLRNYVLNGMQWVLWEKGMDISASGRHFFKGEQVVKRKRVEQYLHQLKQIDTAYKASYDSVLNHKNLRGNNHFYKSDFHVQRSNDYYFSIKMSSKRVQGYETVNFENLLGYHNGSGMSLLYQTQQEYEDIFPFWDWKKLPGTTIIQDTAAIPISNAWGYKIDDDFVGGVSDGENGIAVLKYNRGGLQANKAWFLFKDKIVCLGNGITADTNFRVSTSVNQSFLKGDVWASTPDSEAIVKNELEFSNLNWMLHDNIGYLFPTDESVHLEANNVKGSWYPVANRYPDIDENAQIFNLWIDHGEKPENKSYSYILVPNATKTIMSKLMDNTPFELINTTAQQSAISADGQIAGAIFHTPGTSIVFGGIEVSRPCAVMLKKNTEGISVSISDPSYQLSEISFAINGKYAAPNSSYKDGKTTINIELPQGHKTGKTITVNLNNK